MSRSRNIKPGFFKNEDLAELPFWVRLLYIGIWTEADREGRFEDRPVKLKMAIFPADSVDVDAGLKLLEDGGFILRYASQSKRYGQVIAWKKHQNPHFKEQMSVIPSPESLGFDLHACPVIPQASGAMDDTKASGIDADAGDDDEGSNNSMTPMPEALPPVDGGVNRADSLIPDSLIPDSLIPDSLIPDPLEEREKPSLVKPPKAKRTKAIFDATGFDRFYAGYPRKVSRASALKAFMKIAPSPELLDTIMAALKAQAATTKWRTEPQFIPHPATWLNQARWEDDVASITCNGKRTEPSKTLTGIQKLEARKHANLDRERDSDRLSEIDDLRLGSSASR